MTASGASPAQRTCRTPCEAGRTSSARCELQGGRGIQHPQLSRHTGTQAHRHTRIHTHTQHTHKHTHNTHNTHTHTHTHTDTDSHTHTHGEIQNCMASTTGDSSGNPGTHVCRAAASASPSAVSSATAPPQTPGCRHHDQTSSCGHSRLEADPTSPPPRPWTRCWCAAEVHERWSRVTTGQATHLASQLSSGAARLWVARVVCLPPPCEALLNHAWVDAQTGTLPATAQEHAGVLPRARPPRECSRT